MPLKPLPPARRSCRPRAGDTLETIAARELPGVPRETAVASLREWNPHLGGLRRNFQYVLVSDVVFLEGGATEQGGFA
jgi:hypothetical protein